MNLSRNSTAADRKKGKRIRSSATLDALWIFSDPKASENRFRRFIRAERGGSDPTLYAEALTQLARAQALQSKFGAAHHTLDSVTPLLPGLRPRARIRYSLERGRILNSGGAPGRSVPYFLEGWRVARRYGEDALAVDAAHMLAIVRHGAAQRSWNLKALRLAEGSRNQRARRWRASLLNNIGWSQFESGAYEEASRSFQRALRYRQQEKNPAEKRIARWCVAKALRLLGRTSEALRIQQRLLGEWRRARSRDGFVFEELGECLRVLNRPREARPFFRRAYAELSKDRWLAAKEPKRLRRLRMLGNVQHR